MWNDRTMNALRLWLDPDTWYKRQPFDDCRFYDFLAAVWNEQRTLWNEVEAREIIIREANSIHPTAASRLLIETIRKREAQGTLILDFLTHRNDSGNSVSI